MVSNKMLTLGTSRSCIRELFEYGLKQAALVGKDQVFDFSLGNPYIPAPPEVAAAIAEIAREEDRMSVHSNPVAAGAMEARQAVADDLNNRYPAVLVPQRTVSVSTATPWPPAPWRPGRRWLTT